MRTLDPLCSFCKTVDSNNQFKEVVVIGNGPSGLCLSFILSGRWPYYNGRGHTDLMLQARLQSSSRSLLHSDLPFLSQGVEGRSASPLGSLFDQLIHPGADLGNDTPTLVDWHNNHRPVSHVVIGKNLPGGVWQSMDSNVLTLSLSSWMELPGMSYEEWEGGGETAQPRRVRAGLIADYYGDYVQKTKIAKYMKQGEVTSVTLQEDEDGSEPLWKVEGYDQTMQPFTYITRNVVLATGRSDKANRLGVPGEEDYKYIDHDLRCVETQLKKLSSKSESQRGSILVVGGGLSAADAVLGARFRNLNVIHVFRRRPVLVDRILPDSLYPEYAKVKQMMSCESTDDYPGYQPMPECQVTGFLPDGTVTIQNNTGKESQVQVSLACILIGSRPSLSFIQPCLGIVAEELESKSQLPVDAWTHRVEGPANLKGMYALGPLAGENFVRYLVGGAVAVASDIIRKDKA